MLTLNNLESVYKSKKCSVETMQLKGYELVEELFVDNSGFGAPDEPALTQSQFMQQLTRIVEVNGPMVSTITGEGQFQVYIGLFKKTGKSQVKKIGNNTYDVIYSETKHAIRLHDTDVVTFDSGNIILNSGGWQTNTTKDRLNKYLPRGVRISQHNFEWSVVDDRDGSIKPFTDGMTIAS